MGQKVELAGEGGRAGTTKLTAITRRIGGARGMRGALRRDVEGGWAAHTFSDDRSMLL